LEFVFAAPCFSKDFERPIPVFTPECIEKNASGDVLFVHDTFSVQVEHKITPPSGSTDKNGII